MTFHRGTGSDLDDRDKHFLARLGRALREDSTEFELGGQFIDERFSLLGSNGIPRGSRPKLYQETLRSPQQRFVEALRWAADPKSGKCREERQAICILVWLASDETAHLHGKVLCEFQMIPWHAGPADVDNPLHVARSLWGSRQAAALEALNRRLIHAARRSIEAWETDLETEKS